MWEVSTSGETLNMRVVRSATSVTVPIAEESNISANTPLQGKILRIFFVLRVDIKKFSGLDIFCVLANFFPESFKKA